MQHTIDEGQYIYTDHKVNPYDNSLVLAMCKMYIYGKLIRVHSDDIGKD